MKKKMSALKSFLRTRIKLSTELKVLAVLLLLGGGYYGVDTYLKTWRVGDCIRVIESKADPYEETFVAKLMADRGDCFDIQFVDFGEPKNVKELQILFYLMSIRVCVDKEAKDVFEKVTCPENDHSINVVPGARAGE